ncbi:S9 family peptidase [Sphingomonas sp.]|uniref:S9 family peptidase n=1 Tax=Sphingomonas sp. TaxID=28214 RepID=UPI002DD61D99|nr:prolyl oligopeptidase family serine peptidase [Sphingomonas sp.]
MLMPKNDSSSSPKRILTAFLLASLVAMPAASHGANPARPDGGSISPPASERAAIPKPPAIIAEGIPPLPVSLVAALRPYTESRSAAPVAWHPETRALIVATRFASASQLHSVTGPLMDRRQITFEPDTTNSLRYSPSGDIAIVQKDTDGDEFYQLYTLRDGRLTPLTDGGRNRNEIGGFSSDGTLIGYTSTKRNGADSDFYVMNPRDSASARMVAAMPGGSWRFVGFRAGNTHAVVSNFRSTQESDLYDLDLATGKLLPLAPTGRRILFSGPKIAADGSLWVLSNEQSDVLRLGMLKNGVFTPASPASGWDIKEFEFVGERRIAYIVNEAGVSRLNLLDLETRELRTASIPVGVASKLTIAPWGAIAFSLSGPKVPGDVFVADPSTLEVTRWTASETGGIDPSGNADAELVTVKSFDGEPVSGFLFRPDPTRFPGKRPLIVDIHGGPESQSLPSYRGVANYYVNELGIAIFYPNVRGSGGFGKRFLTLDNGPWKREDAVKDIGAFLDRFSADTAIDAGRVGVQGASYGGYMCYASAIRYGDRLKGANCIVAISNFVTFLQNTESYRRDRRRAEYGDERESGQRARLLEISPLTSVSRLKTPLLVIAGGNDPRVPPSEAEQMVKAVRASGGEPWYLVAADEGHDVYFAKKENRDFQHYTTLNFWQKYLLGVTE